MAVSAVALAATVAAGSAGAAGYPSQPIRIIIPFAPGGGADLPGRLLAEKLSQAWGQSVVVENRPGATGSIAESFVARSAPDGYTVLLATPSSHTIGPHLLKNISFDPLEDLRGVTLFGWVPNVLVVNPSVPAGNLQELIALAKQKPGALNYSSSGQGSSVQVTTETFAQQAGITLTHIPYNGVTPAVTAVISGQVQMMFAPAALALPQIKAGKLRQMTPLVDTAKIDADWSRTPSQTVAQRNAANWLGFVMPARTPENVVRTWQDALATIMQSQDVREKFAEWTIIPADTSGAPFDAIIKKEYQESGAMLKRLDIDPS
ncbi:MAG TPA: tripartite tricarboxylate transporter substrate-binding protein [Bordetella sp.]